MFYVFSQLILSIAEFIWSTRSQSLILENVEALMHFIFIFLQETELSNIRNELVSLKKQLEVEKEEKVSFVALHIRLTRILVWFNLSLIDVIKYFDKI